MKKNYFLRTPVVSSIDFAAELNGQQLEAVRSEPGAALVIAGAGSGKTRTLTHRVAWLLSSGIPANSILLLTFTNKAAREMLERVAALVPGQSEGVWGGTFHSIGNRLLRRHSEQAGLRDGFSILDRDDQEQLLDAVVAQCKFRQGDKSFPKAGVLADILSFAVNTCQPVRRVIGERYPYFYRMVSSLEKIAEMYEERKRAANSVDFDDLLHKVFQLLESHSDLRAEYQSRFRHILVDEYQDTNLLQAKLIDLLAAKHRSVMVVGDDAQSIYSWRGADCSNILDFPKRYPETKIFKIETNYRSVPEVLQLANASIAENRQQFEKNLRATRPAGAVKPAVVPLISGNQQAAFVAQRIEDLRDEGVSYSEMAVLYRAHFHSMEIQMEFTRRGIPFSITSGLRFFEQAHIKDVGCFLKLVVNPSDEIAFKRIAKLLPGLGAKSAESLWEKSAPLLAPGGGFAALHGLKPPSKAASAWTQLVHTLEEIGPPEGALRPDEMIHTVLLAMYEDYMRTKFPNYDNRREDLETLTNYAKTFDSTEEFLAQLTLMTSVDAVGTPVEQTQDSEQVTLSSVHQAKGLEWSVVFVVSLADGMFPGARSLEKDDALEEERRLFYVAVTRCKDELFLTYPEFRAGGGAYGEGLQSPSRFLESLPGTLYDEWNVQPSLSGPPAAAGDPF